MKLVSYLNGNQVGYGVVEGEDVIDLRSVFGDQAPDLKTFIAKNLLEQVSGMSDGQCPRLKLDQLTLLPVIHNPGQIFCVGLNYHAHVQEGGRTVTEAPAFFQRVPASQVAHRQDIVLPPESVQLDFEGEIAVVIGRGGRRISEADAWNHVFGYSCYNDGSIRDWQTATSQWTAGKNFWRTGGFGPWLVTADEIPPGRVMTLVTRLNGQEMQRTTSDLMIHSIPRQIAYLSTFTPLEPGDVIVTGTPGGVGLRRDPPVFMKAGDICEIEVDAIGILRNGVQREQVG